MAAESDADPAIAAGSFGDPRFLRRLAWLDSPVAQDAELVSPFTAITLDESEQDVGDSGQVPAAGGVGASGAGDVHLHRRRDRN